MKEVICENCGAKYRGEEIPEYLKCVCQNEKFKIVKKSQKEELN